MLIEANKHFAGFETKVSLPNGAKVAVSAGQRDEIRVELFKNYLAKKAMKEEPALREQIMKEFQEKNPMMISLIIKDPLTGIESTKEFIEMKGKDCALILTESKKSTVGNAIHEHPCLKSKLTMAEESQMLTIVTASLAPERLKIVDRLLKT